MPSYTWVCGACTTSNPPGHEDCVACHCPAQSSQALREKYRAAWEGVGPPVMPATAGAPTPQVPRPSRFKQGAWWFAAAGALVGLAAIAAILLWGAAPWFRGDASQRHWSLPDGLLLASIATVLLAPIGAVLCALAGWWVRGKLSLSTPAGWLVLILLASLGLSMCAG